MGKVYACARGCVRACSCVGDRAWEWREEAWGEMRAVARRAGRPPRTCLTASSAIRATPVLNGCSMYGRKRDTPSGANPRQPPSRRARMTVRNTSRFMSLAWQERPGYGGHGCRQGRLRRRRGERRQRCGSHAEQTPGQRP
eukprot:scaffold22199_cov118-Isochrysis_galbana.AAC.7